jgi:hypothetical protein
VPFSVLSCLLPLPEEGLWVLVVVLDEGFNGLFEFFGGTVNSAPKLLSGERDESAFHQVEP